MTSLPPFLSALQCMRCGKLYAPGEIEYVCDCQPNLGSDMGTLDAIWNYDAIAQKIDPRAIAGDADQSIGRFLPLLPIVDRASLPPVAVGNTPLLPTAHLRKHVGLRALYVKDDGRNPSGSLKDRASAIAVARAQELGYPVVATASTGNAAAALAGQSAAAGMPAVIFVPRSAPPAKIAQLLAYGARVLALDGSYDQAFDLCVEACLAFRWYNRNTGYNPYMSEGKKTVAYEIALQLAHAQGSRDPFVAPDAIFVSVGDGCIIGAIYKGFHDLLRLGWIEKMPRIYGVQSLQSAALARAWRTGMDVPAPVHATTRADSISVDSPRDALKALRAVRASGGAFITVEDAQILEAILPLARLGGVFGEPAGSAALAGLVQGMGRDAGRNTLVDADETIVVINTGSGLKDIAAVMQVTGEVKVIAPRMADVRAAVGQDGRLHGATA